MPSRCCCPPLSSTAVILARLVAPAPVFSRAARGGFARQGRAVEAAALDGASPGRIFRPITVPLTLPVLRTGLILHRARAGGAFGATMLFAGGLIGRTRAVPLAVMGATESDLYAAPALSVPPVAPSFAASFPYRLIGGRAGRS